MLERFFPHLPPENDVKASAKTGYLYGPFHHLRSDNVACTLKIERYNICFFLFYGWLILSLYRDILILTGRDKTGLYGGALNEKAYSWSVILDRISRGDIWRCAIRCFSFTE